MKIVANFDPFMNYTSWPKLQSFNTQVPPGSLLKMLVYNRSPVDLLFTFHDARGSTDIMPAYCVKYFELPVVQPTVDWITQETSGGDQLPTFSQVFVVVFDPDETVQGTYPMLLHNSSHTFTNPTTVPFTGSSNPSITFPASTPNVLLLQYIDGFDITCSALPSGQTARLLQVQMSGAYGNYSWNYWLNLNTGIQDHVTFPGGGLVIPNNGSITFTVVFVNTIGTATGSLTVYTHSEY